MAEGDEFLGRIDAGRGDEFARGAVGTTGHHAHVAARPEAVGDATQVERLGAGQTQLCAIPAGLELQLQRAHVDQVASVNAWQHLGE